MGNEARLADLKAKAQAMLQGSLKCVQAATLAVALVPLGAVAVAPAEAGVAIQRSSRVDATVIPPGGLGNPSATEFLYLFEVFNTTPGSGLGINRIVDWELPIFALTDVANIMSPSGWLSEVIAPTATTAVYNNPTGTYGLYSWNYNPATDPLLVANPNLYGPNPGAFVSPPFIIHWFTDDDGGEGPVAPIFEGDSLPGFSFMSDFGGTSAPYLASWFFQPPRGGDPPIPERPGFAFPNSDSFQQTQQAPIPEPATLLLLASGAGVLLLRRRGKI